MTPSVREIVLGFGANLGSRIATIEAAIELASAELTVVARSPFYETDPIGPPQPRYVNAAARVRTHLSLEEILDRALAVERALGRERRERWGPRSIDIDLLWAGDESIATDRLVVPHPRLHERAFALAPLLSVAPEAAETLAAALRSCGGPPPVVEPPRVAVTRTEGGISAVAEGGDPEDALAFALGALGEDAPGIALEVATEALDPPDATGAVASLCRVLARGYRVRAVSLALGPPAGPVLRVVGGRGSPGERPIPTNGRAHRSNGVVSVEVEFRREQAK